LINDPALTALTAVKRGQLATFKPDQKFFRDQRGDNFGCNSCGAKEFIGAVVIGILSRMPAFRPVALITGGAKRVGAAIARKLAASGYDLVFSYHRSADDAEQLLADLKNFDVKAVSLQADLSDPESAVDAIARAVIANFPRLDLLVNNASQFHKSDLAGISVAQLRADYSIHVEAPLLLAKFFVDHLKRSQGTVINMIDLLAEKPHPSYLSYCASKAALANLTLSLARELAPDVTVNGIAPGAVDWPDDYTIDMREKYLQRVPLKRAGTPEDVANLVHFLATEGKYITGQIIRLDGGRSLT